MEDCLESFFIVSHGDVSESEIRRSSLWTICTVFYNGLSGGQNAIARASLQRKKAIGDGDANREKRAGRMKSAQKYKNILVSKAIAI